MFLAAVFSNLSGIEALWIGVAAIGAIITAINLFDSVQDKHSLTKKNIRNGRRLIANVTLLNESTRILIHLIFLAIGILAATLPNPPENANLPSTQQAISFLIRWGLITASVLLVTQSVSLRLMRRKLAKGD